MTAGESALSLVGARVEALNGWRGATLARVAALIRAAVGVHAAPKR